MEHQDHEHLWAMAIFAVAASVIALFVSLGPCIRQEKVENKVEHLETRLDNLRDHG